MKKKYTQLFSITLFTLLLFEGCNSSVSNVKWNYSENEVVGEKPPKTDAIALDVYVDATTSMQGFVSGNGSVYGQFLDQLEASALSAWRKADTRFYKFGDIIKPIDRTAFLAAKSSPAFYHEPGIFTKTYIDSVVNRTNKNRLSVLITDLFQDEGDVNVMVERFKEKCFSNGVAVGVMGIRSAYDGRVFDVPAYPQGYPLKAQDRPFYAVIFGNQYNMELLVKALKSKASVGEEPFLIFTPYIVTSENVKLEKAKGAAINNKKAAIAIKNSFDFGMNADVKEAKMDLSVDLERNNSTADFSEKAIEIIAYKKSAVDAKSNANDSTLTNDVTIENIQRVGDKLTATVTIKSEDAKGNYSYAVYLKLNSLTGLRLPAWVSSFSTDNPVAGTPSAGKTYNFEKLCSRLLVANASVAPTCISQFYINLYKH